MNGNVRSLCLVAWLVFFSLPCVLGAPHVHAERDTAPEVTINGATFVGSTDDTYGVSSWLGIRYAQPPVESLRLQPPQAIDNKGTVYATSFGPQCFQLPLPTNANVSEDCLFLNIYKPSKAALKEAGHDESTDCLPVMFWIHGGGFNTGSGQIYDSRSLVNTSGALQTPIIVVTINYRLSFFGFSGTFYPKLFIPCHAGFSHRTLSPCVEMDSPHNVVLPFFALRKLTIFLHHSWNNCNCKQCPQSRSLGSTVGATMGSR